MRVKDKRKERTVDIAAIALVLALTAIPNNSAASTIGQRRRHTNAPVQIVRLLSLAGRLAITLCERRPSCPQAEQRPKESNTGSY